MNNNKLIKMLETEEASSLDNVLQDIFENHLKPSKVGLDAYNKFRAYKKNYYDGRLGKKGLENLLEFFGYEVKDTIVGKIKTSAPLSLQKEEE